VLKTLMVKKQSPLDQLQLHVTQDTTYPPLTFVLPVLQIQKKHVKNLVKVQDLLLLVLLVLPVLQAQPQLAQQDVKVKDLLLLERLVWPVLHQPQLVNQQL